MSNINLQNINKFIDPRIGIDNESLNNLPKRDFQNNNNYNGPKVVDDIIDNSTTKYLLLNPDNIKTNQLSVNNPYSYSSVEINRGRERLTRINVDSRYRNTIPKNKLLEYIKLPNNPLTFVQDSDIIIINHPKHNYNEDDKIIIQNVISKVVVLKNPLVLTTGSEYVKVKHPNHGITQLDMKYNDFYIAMSGVIGNKENGTYINNLPITLFNKTHKVYLTLTNVEPVDPNYYYIMIPIPSDNNYQDTNNNVTVVFENLQGVPLNRINSNYPLNDNQLIGYQIIDKIIDENTYQIKITTRGVRNINNQGGNNVNVNKITNIDGGYPEPSSYIIDLKKTLYNVKRINLINSEFPISDTVIKNYPLNQKNNTLSWQILQDGSFIYTTFINSGNYTSESLSIELMKSIDRINRVSITEEYYTDGVNCPLIYTKNNISYVNINVEQNITTFKLFGRVLLLGDNNIKKAITKDTTIYTDPYTRVIINQYNHRLEINDEIIIEGAIDSQNIPASALNGVFTIESIIDENNYIIRLPIYNDSIINTYTGGGNTVKITYPLYFRLLLNDNTSICKLLGYRNVGGENSITTFEQTITNNQPYDIDFLFNEIGNSIITDNGTILTPRINLNGENYILMTIPIIDNSINIGPVSNVLAKIGLYGDVGNYIYNSYTMLARDFDKNITAISNLQISFYLPTGEYYNFNNMNHSYTLEIVEDLNELINSDQNTRNGL